jgi:hypothetical protein
LHFDQAPSPGVYRVQQGSDSAAIRFVVNSPTSDSPLATMDQAALKEWWTPLSMEVTTSDSITDGAGSARATTPLWPFLALLACLLLMAEIYYVHRLCPRAAPKVATMIVARQAETPAPVSTATPPSGAVVAQSATS